MKLRQVNSVGELSALGLSESEIGGDDDRVLHGLADQRGLSYPPFCLSVNHAS